MVFNKHGVDIFDYHLQLFQFSTEFRLIKEELLRLLIESLLVFEHFRVFWHFELSSQVLFNYG